MSKEALARAALRLKIIAIKKVLEEDSFQKKINKSTLLEFNDVDTWKKIATIVSAELNDNGFDNCTVICDESTNTDETIMKSSIRWIVLLPEGLQINMIMKAEKAFFKGK